MKTPEEMAYEYGEKFDGVEISKNDINIAWYTGYKAAQEHAHAALEEAEAEMQELRDQLAGVSIVMPDSWDHILDATKMVDVNGWISVKDKSPEINQRVLLATNEKRSIVTGHRLSPAGKNEPWFHTDLGLWCGTETVTHWMPLPEPPKEEE
jgi:hypothetical protein